MLSTTMCNIFADSAFLFLSFKAYALLTPMEGAAGSVNRDHNEEVKCVGTIKQREAALVE